MIGRIIGLLLAVGLFLSTGCRESYLYSEVQEISGPWTYSDSKDFTFDIADTAAYYDLFLDIWHDPDFRFQNLYTRIDTEYPDQSGRTENLSIQMAAKTGAWYGKCNRRVCQTPIALQENVFFDQPGVHRIIFNQYSRMDSLFGIQKLHLKIRKRPSNSD